MANLNKYYLADRKVFKTNRDVTYVFKAYFPKKQPKGAREEVYRALRYIGILP